MKELFLSILNASLHGSIVIAAVLILRLVLKKAPRALFCLLWLLAGLRLVLPFEIESRLSLQPDMEPVVLNQTVEIPVAAEMPDTTLPLPQEEMPADTQQEAPREQTGFVYIEENETIRLPELGDILCWVWLAGAAVMLMGSMISYFRLKHRLREAWKTEDGAWTCPELDTAFVLGILKPRIYLPAGLKEPERGLILNHERTHISRCDHISKLAGYWVLAVHWFNPLVWVGYACLCRDIEMACDERVVRGMDVQARKDYSRALLNCAGSHGGLTACPVAFGETSVKQRIVSVLNYRKPGFWVMVVAVVALVFVVVCLMTSPVKKQPEVPDIHDGANWGITFSAENVTPRGMTLVCEQDGTPVPGMLMTGAFFRLEKLTADGWRELPTVTDAIFTTEGWMITKGQTHRWDVNWAWLYGELEPGDYRIFKTITLDETQGSETDWNGGVEFTITEQDQEDERLTRCREALASFQAQSTYCLMIQRQMSGDILNDNATQMFYVSGEDWLRHCVIDEVDFIEEDWYLNKNGRQFTKYTTHHNHDGNGEDINTGWVEGPLEENEIFQPWLRTFDLDAQPVDFLGFETDGNLDTVTFRVYGNPLPGDDLMEVADYTVEFVFYRDSRTLHQVILRYTQTWSMRVSGEDTTGVGYMVATMTPNAAGEDMVLQMLEAMYNQAITN